MTIYTVDKLQEIVQNAESSSETGSQFYQAIHRLAQIYQAWQKSQSQANWEKSLAELRDESGNPLFSPDEVPTFAPAINQIFTSLAEVSGNYQANIQQSGGKFPQGTPVKGPDDVVQMIMDRIGAVDDMSRRYAREYGLLKMLNDSDQGKRQNFKTPVIPEIGLFTPIPVSPRLVIAFTYALIEIIRVLVSGTVPALKSDLLRKILSLTLAVIDLLFGRWKQAILSFAGFFGPGVLYTTLVLKTALDVFYVISPEIRKEIVYTTLDSFKSLIIGLIITSFQTFAPAPVRARVEEGLRGFNDSIEKINQQLVGAGLAPLPSELFFSFSDLNNLQVLVRKPEIICSKEMEAVVAIFNQDAPSLGFALQLLGYPTDSGRRGGICRRAGYTLGESTLVELLVANSKHRTAAEAAAATADKISAESGAESTAAVLATPTEAVAAATVATAAPAQSPDIPIESSAPPAEPGAVPELPLSEPQPQPALLPPQLQQAREQMSSIPEEIPKSIHSALPKPAPFGKLSSLRAKMPQ
jgi:hypothetical protein